MIPLVKERYAIKFLSNWTFNIGNRNHPEPEHHRKPNFLTNWNTLETILATSFHGGEFCTQSLESINQSNFHLSFYYFFCFTFLHTRMKQNSKAQIRTDASCVYIFSEGDGQTSGCYSDRMRMCVVREHENNHVCVMRNVNWKHLKGKGKPSLSF